MGTLLVSMLLDALKPTWSLQAHVSVMGTRGKLAVSASLGLSWDTVKAHSGQQGLGETLKGPAPSGPLLPAQIYHHMDAMKPTPTKVAFGWLWPTLEHQDLEALSVRAEPGPPTCRHLPQGLAAHCVYTKSKPTDKTPLERHSWQCPMAGPICVVRKGLFTKYSGSAVKTSLWTELRSCNTLLRSKQSHFISSSPWRRYSSPGFPIVFHLGT